MKVNHQQRATHELKTNQNTIETPHLENTGNIYNGRRKQQQVPTVSSLEIRNSTRQQQINIETLKYLLGFFYNIISNQMIGLVKAVRWNHTELVWINQFSYTENTPDIIHFIM